MELTIFPKDKTCSKDVVNWTLDPQIQSLTLYRLSQRAPCVLFNVVVSLLNSIQRQHTGSLWHWTTRTRTRERERKRERERERERESQRERVWVWEKERGQVLVGTTVVSKVSLFGFACKNNTREPCLFISNHFIFYTSSKRSDINIKADSNNMIKATI